GVFTYRTIDDVAALRAWVQQRAAGGRPVRGAVIGGGLLGLEAAGALRELGALVTVVQAGSHLMDTQLDLGGGQALRRLINDLGVAVRTESLTTRISRSRQGNAGTLHFADGGRLKVDVVVIAIGVRPRDELARAAGLEIGPRGGVVVDNACRT